MTESPPSVKWMANGIALAAALKKGTAHMTCIAETLEAALIGADLNVLDDISRRLWAAYSAGDVTDIDAETISEAIEARRKAIRTIKPPSPPKPKAPPARRQCQSPDRRESIQRRRRVASSGAMPPQIAAQFTEGERAALAIVAGETRTKGYCDLPIDAIAGRAGVGRTTVQNALRVARGLRLLNVEERPRPGRKNLTNIISITSGEWSSWLRLGRHRVQAGERDQYRKDSLSSLAPLAALPWGSGSGYRIQQTSGKR
jgi:hypothetical protein